MRVLSISAAAEVARRNGSEPVTVIGIDFSNQGNFLYFSDRFFDGITGLLANISEIESVMTIQYNSSVTSMSFMLLDANNFLREIYHTIDLHKKTFRIYQYYPNTNFETDKIMLFDGWLTSPITYDITAGTLSLTGSSRLEDVEIGFSPDNAVWTHVIPNEIESQAWPMTFGTPVNYPLPSITKVPYGSLIHGFGIPDPTLSQYNAALDISAGSLLGWQVYCALIEAACLATRDDYLHAAEETVSYIAALERMADEAANASAQANYDYQAIEQANAEMQASASAYAQAYPDAQVTTTYGDSDTYQERGAYYEDMARSYESEIARLTPLVGQYNSLASQAAGLANQWHSEQLRAVSEYAARRSEAARRQREYAAQQAYSRVGSYISIWNGKTFPQGTKIWLNVGGCLVYGQFKYEGEDRFADAGEPDNFYVSQVVHPEECCYFGRHCEELGCTDYEVVIPGTTYGLYYNYSNENERAMWQADSAGLWSAEYTGFSTAYTDVNRDSRGISNTRNLATSDQAGYGNQKIVGTQAGFAWIPAGSRVRIAYSNPVEYIISIVPCTVEYIAAYRTFAGARHLTKVPTEYYTMSTRDYGEGLVAQVLTLTKPLSAIAGYGFEDQVYAAVTSSIGPDIVDIITYLIQRYLPTITCDAISFTAAKTRTGKYPANFVLLERKNILEVLSDICYQSCLVLWFSNGIAYLRHLQQVPIPAALITLDDISITSLTMTHTATEDIITKYVSTYKVTYDQEDPYQIAIRYNTAKYGVTEESTDYFIYTNRSSVVRSATYWAIRRGNVWKKVQFTTALNTLILESMDAVRLRLPELGYELNDVIGVVEETLLNTDEFTITYIVWLPVRSGEIISYRFLYSDDSDVHVDDYFPEPVDWVSGNGIGSPIIRDLEDGIAANQVQIQSNTSPYTALSVEHNHPENVFVPVDRKIGWIETITEEGAPRFPVVDAGYQSGEEPDTSGSSDNSIQSPYSVPDNFEPNPPDGEIDALEEEGAQTIISLHGTRIVDRATRKVATLATIFAACDDNTNISASAPVLNLRTTLGVKITQDQISKFELRYDEVAKAHGAKLAFLKEDESV
jgi:hypothetical protein